MALLEDLENGVGYVNEETFCSQHSRKSPVGSRLYFLDTLSFDTDGHHTNINSVNISG